MRSHKAFTPNDECFFLFLDVSDQYVARWVFILDLMSSCKF